MASPWLAAAFAGGTLLDMWGQAEGATAQIDALIRTADQHALDASAIEESLTDQINEMERVIYRNIGSAVANVGASGVAMRGSPMDALIQMHGIAQQEMEAAFRQRDVEVNRKYMEAINTLKPGSTIARQTALGMAGTAIQGGRKAAQAMEWI